MAQAAPDPTESTEDGETSAVELATAGIKREHSVESDPPTPGDASAAVNAITYDLLIKARGIYERAIDERWVKGNIHGELICPVCAALVPPGTAGKIKHTQYHRGEAPNLGPILAELESLADVLRGLVEQQ